MKKTRLLPNIDLARIMHRSREEMRLHLKSIESGFPALTYNPTRSVLPDLLNEQGDLLDGEKVEWSVIEAQIAKFTKRGALELKHNLIISKLLHDYALGKSIWSKRHEFFPLKLIHVGGIKFWWDLYFIEDGRAVVPFVDPRKTRGLSKEDMRVVFSFMNERIRVPGSDFEDSRLAIIQFPENKSGTREVKVTYDDGFELYSFDQLSVMVDQLYSEWEAELREREAVNPRPVAVGSLI
jgi:hypothetical protein